MVPAARSGSGTGAIADRPRHRATVASLSIDPVPRRSRGTPGQLNTATNAMSQHRPGAATLASPADDDAAPGHGCPVSASIRCRDAREPASPCMYRYWMQRGLSIDPVPRRSRATLGGMAGHFGFLSQHRPGAATLAGLRCRRGRGAEARLSIDPVPRRSRACDRLA